jgi:hypothetical protein
VENILTDARREKIWEKLSDLFVDTETCYEWIIPEVVDVDPDLLKEILYNEVAPYCAPNFMTVIPPVWTGFAAASLVSGIREILENSRKSRFAMLKYKVSVAFYRLWFKWIWKEFSAGLTKYKNENPTRID